MPEQYDVIVVGGGCNGTGIARDSALRGLKTLLLEKNDFASGTTGASSGMIHGGPRYLTSEVKTTRTSSQDAGAIKKIAPHLTFRIPFLYPIFRGRGAKTKLFLVEAFFQAYDKYSALKGGRPHTRLTAAEARSLEPSLSPDVAGAVTFDEWGIDTPRLCVANALAVRDHGGTVRNHTKVRKILKENDTVVGLLAQNLLTGEEFEFRSRLIFNATGPWAPQLAAMAGCEVKLRPAKGIHLVLDRRITNVAILSRCIDGRQIFINPHENTTLLGTTDDDYYGDPDQIPVTEDEIEYLLQGMERSYPAIRKARIISTTRGVRPTLYRQGIYEDDLSRDHRIYDHEKQEGIKGFLSIAGGKLAAYRLMAEEATDLVCKKLRVRASCTTDLVPLPGGESQPDPNEVARDGNLHPYTAARIVSRHGSRTPKLLEEMREKPEETAILCPCEPVTAAEVRHVVREEWAHTLSDICRRTRLGSGPCQGSQCLLPAAAILAEERSADPIGELKNFLAESLKARAPVLRGIGLAQEEMLQMIYRCVLDLESV